MVAGSEKLMVCRTVRLKVAGVDTPLTLARAVTELPEPETGEAVIEARPLLSVAATPPLLKLSP